MHALDMIARSLAAPMTHRVVTKYDDGKVRTHETRNESSAQNYAFTDKRRIGAPLKDRETNAVRRIVSVEIVALS